MLAFPPGSGASDGQVVVTLDDGQEFTWLGRSVDTTILYQQYGDDLSGPGVEALCDAWQLHIIDPQRPAVERSTPLRS